jgi:hypothetical protein
VRGGGAYIGGRRGYANGGGMCKKTRAEWGMEIGVGQRGVRR